MFNLSFSLKDGKTIVLAERNKMYCTSIARQLNADDGGVIAYNTDLSDYANVIFLFKGDLVIPSNLQSRDDVIYFDINCLIYSPEYWNYIQTTQSLLDELVKLLPADSLVRIEREKFKSEYQKAQLARVSR